MLGFVSSVFSRFILSPMCEYADCSRPSELAHGEICQYQAAILEIIWHLHNVVPHVAHNKHSILHSWEWANGCFQWVWYMNCENSYDDCEQNLAYVYSSRLAVVLSFGLCGINWLEWNLMAVPGCISGSAYFDSPYLYMRCYAMRW